MAVWQVDFYLLPRAAVATPIRLTPSVLNDSDWWGTAAFPSDYQQRLAVVATPAHSASPDVEVWGTAESNRVAVWSSGGRVRRAVARIDVRRLDSRFGAALLGFVRVAGAVLVRSDGLIVEPIISAYATAIRTSEAWAIAGMPAERPSVSTPDDDVDDRDDE